MHVDSEADDIFNVKDYYPDEKWLNIAVGLPTKLRANRPTTIFITENVELSVEMSVMRKASILYSL